MSIEILNSIGILVAIAISIASFFTNARRSGHQNQADDGTYVKNMAETTSITTKARLEAEQRAAKMEIRIADLEKMLSDMAYRVTFVVHTGEEPRIETISVERFPNRRTKDDHPAMNRRKEVQ